MYGGRNFDEYVKRVKDEVKSMFLSTIQFNFIRLVNGYSSIISQLNQEILGYIKRNDYQKLFNILKDLKINIVVIDLRKVKKEKLNIMIGNNQIVYNNKYFIVLHI